MTARPGCATILVDPRPRGLDHGGGHEELGLAEGQEVVAVIKASDVMIGRPDA